MALSANRSVDIMLNTGFELDFVVTNAVTVYAGGIYAILISTGFVVVPTSASAPTVQQCCLLAKEKCVGDGVKKCKFYSEAVIWHAISGATVASVGKPVYNASNSDDTLTLTGTPYTTACVGTTVGWDAARSLLAIKLKPIGVAVDALS